MERKEAIEIARKLYNESLFLKKDKEAMVTLIPELAENGDERIRKTIYNCVKWFGFDSCFFKDISQEECLAWLERQEIKEHNVYDTCDEKASCVNPCPVKLIESENERIRKSIIAFLTYYHTGQGNSVKYDDGWIAWLEKQGQTFTKKDVDDAYLKGICDAKQELEKQGEQKPADLPNGEDYGIDGLYAAVDILQKTLVKVGGYQTDDGILEHECAISAVKKLYEQKPAEWSEEDEKIFKSILEELKSHIGVTRDEYCKYFYWLKSLKPKSQWKPSDEQMEYLAKAITTLGDEGDCKTALILNDLRFELKKLREE